MRLHGKKFNALLRQEVVETLSERHAAHAAGLGTFGLCDGLITPLGKAMRTGSVVVRAALPAKRSLYQDHRAYCLYYKPRYMRQVYPAMSD